MATEIYNYGVKYRLTVGDVEGASWKIDIEEKDFVGSSTNFIGDGTAFDITWEQNEDYDKAIIGSLARINILAKPVLDSGTPDFTDLFTTDETKFRVKIYYTDTNNQDILNSPAFITGRGDNTPYSDLTEATISRGVREKFKVWTTIPNPASVGRLTGAQFFTDEAKTTPITDGFYRVESITGLTSNGYGLYVIETVGGAVVSQSIPTTNYQLYWQGFVVQDDYVEEVTSDPYRISIVATENLGKLKTFPFNDNDASRHEELQKPNQILFDALVKIGLAIDCYDLSGYQLPKAGLPNGDNFGEQVLINSNALLRGEVFNNYESYFSVLESHLKSINCFLVQAFGDLWIVPEAAYDSIVNNNFDWQSYKLSFGSASFSSAAYDAFDLPFSTNLRIPEDFRVIDRSLIKTKRSAVNASVIEYPIKNRNIFYNGSFEVNKESPLEAFSAAWQRYEPIGASFVSINHDDDFSGEPTATTATNSGSGERCAVVSLDASNTIVAFNNATEAVRNTTYTLLKNESGDAGTHAIRVPFRDNHSSGNDYELEGTLSFKVYISGNTIGEPVTFRYSIQWETSLFNYNYYDFENTSWQNAHAYGESTITEVGSWQTITATIPFPVFDHTSRDEANVIFRLHPCSEESGAASALVYIDDVSLVINQPEGSSEAITLGNNSYIISKEETENLVGNETSTTNAITGLTNFYDANLFSSELTERTNLLSGMIANQLLDVTPLSLDQLVLDAKWSYDKLNSTPRTQPLQQWVNEHRWDKTKVTQTYLQGVIKNMTNVNGVHQPISMLGVLTLSFRGGSYDTGKYLITRMSINPKANLVNFVAKNIVETQGDYDPTDIPAAETFDNTFDLSFR